MHNNIIPSKFWSFLLFFAFFFCFLTLYLPWQNLFDIKSVNEGDVFLFAISILFYYIFAACNDINLNFLQKLVYNLLVGTKGVRIIKNGSLVKFLVGNKNRIILYISNIVISFFMGILSYLFIKRIDFLKGGVNLVVVFSIMLTIISLIYLAAYNYISSLNINIKRYKYFLICLDFLAFMFYYKVNYKSILESIEETPKYISKTTFVFLLYFFLYIIINLVIITIVSKSVKLLKVGMNSVEVQFENGIIEGLKDISTMTSDITACYAKLIDAMQTMVESKFSSFNLNDEYELDVFYSFYSDVVTMLFTDTKIEVQVRLVSKKREKALRAIINKTDSSIILRANTYDKIMDSHIVRLNNLIFIPIFLDLIEINSIIVVEFDKEENCITYFGNIIYALIKYTDSIVSNVLSDKALQELDEIISKLQ